jgi:hypothetical protein
MYGRPAGRAQSGIEPAAGCESTPGRGEGRDARRCAHAGAPLEATAEVALQAGQAGSQAVPGRPPSPALRQRGMPSERAVLLRSVRHAMCA